MARTTERIPFRLLVMPCCGAMICHVNHRWPSYCSNCGTRVYPEIKGCATVEDMDASLIYDSGMESDMESDMEDRRVG